MTDSETNNRGTILVVEDDPGVRDLAISMFQSEGFQVYSATTAAEGLDRFNEHPDINLVFTDVIMPGGLSGVDLTKKILKLRPKTLVLLATGYRDKGEAIEDSTMAIENISYIAKPYDVEEIPKLVQHMLEQAVIRDAGLAP